VAYEKEVSGRIMRDKTLAAIKKNLDWLEFIPHGLIHLPREFEKCDYETMKDYVLPAIDEAFKRDDLPYVKGFKAPYWLWNKDVIRALDDAGWWGAIDRNNVDMAKTKKYYVWSHSIAEPFSLSTLDTIKLHGHITGANENGLEKCLTNLIKMPSDAIFKFASEMVQDETS